MCHCHCHCHQVILTQRDFIHNSIRTTHHRSTARNRSSGQRLFCLRQLSGSPRAFASLASFKARRRMFTTSRRMSHTSLVARHQAHADFWPPSVMSSFCCRVWRFLLCVCISLVRAIVLTLADCKAPLSWRIELLVTKSHVLAEKVPWDLRVASERDVHRRGISR